MTEPDERATPLSRMQFSWQRGAPPPQREEDPHDVEGGPAARTPDAYEAEAWTQDVDMPVDEPMAYAPPPTEPRPAPEAPPPPATRLGRAADRSARLPESRRGTLEADRFEEPLRLEEPPRRPRRVRPETTATREPDERSSNSKKKRAKGGKSRHERFDVPPPGGRFSGGRGSHVFVRVLLLLTACLLLVGIVGYLSYSLGVQTGRDATYTLDEGEKTKYRLTDFPIDQAGRFAADYARICLTHEKTPEADAPRLAQIGRYVSKGVDTSCGWQGDGEQEVLDSSPTGASEPVAGPGEPGHTRMMTVRVLTEDKKSRVLSVPVYVANLQTGQGMRIVGDIGEVPQPILAEPAEPEPRGGSDQQLASALVDGKFFAQFFEAWGASDQPTINRLVTSDAGEQVRAGLTGSLTDPSIQQAKVFLPEGEEADGHAWKKGDKAEAWVWVAWKNPDAGEDVTQTRAYRLTLVMATEGSNPAQSWAVQDIRGGVPSLGVD